MSRFGKYLGYLKIEVAGEEIEVRPTLRHKQKLLGIQQNATKSGLTEADWAEQHKIFFEILKTSPEELTDEEVEAILLRHDMDFMTGLYIGFGWTKKEDLAGLKDELRKKVVAKD